MDFFTKLNSKADDIEMGFEDNGMLQLHTKSVDSSDLTSPSAYDFKS